MLCWCYARQVPLKGVQYFELPLGRIPEAWYHQTSAAAAAHYLVAQPHGLLYLAHELR
jgi:hypothetical protein